MICKCGEKMRTVDIRHNKDSGESYRKYQCPKCKLIIYTAEEAVEADEYFIRRWRSCSRKAMQRC